MVSTNKSALHINFTLVGQLENSLSVIWDCPSFIGLTYLQQFCAAAVNAVVSPFVLQDIAVEAAHYLSRNNPAQVPAQLRSQTLNPLVQKCLQMWVLSW